MGSLAVASIWWSLLACWCGVWGGRALYNKGRRRLCSCRLQVGALLFFGACVGLALSADMPFQRFGISRARRMLVKGHSSVPGGPRGTGPAPRGSPEDPPRSGTPADPLRARKIPAETPKSGTRIPKLSRAITSNPYVGLQMKTDILLFHLLNYVCKRFSSQSNYFRRWFARADDGWRRTCMCCCLCCALPSPRDEGNDA